MIRPIDFSKDYEILERWWKEHNWLPVHPSLLPKTGFIVDEVCAGWLYKTDSAFALLEFVVSDKNAEKDRRDKALNILINSLLEEADKAGFKVVFTSLEHPKLIERYQKFGFKVTDKNMTNMVRSL